MSIMQDSRMGLGRKNIVFDVGMVLVDFCWQKACRSLGIAEEAIVCFDQGMIHSEEWRRLDEGTIGEGEAVMRFKQRMPQFAAEVERFWGRPELLVEEYPYAAPLIRELKERGLSVYLLSNYPEHMYRLHWPGFSFLPLVDGYVVSAVEKLAKPDPRIYRLLCERYGLVPEECLFVDDRADNVEAAGSVGMGGVVFEGEAGLRGFLGLERTQ